MGRYSSDSDSDRGRSSRRKKKGKTRSDSSASSDSDHSRSHRRHKPKKKSAKSRSRHSHRRRSSSSDSVEYVTEYKSKKSSKSRSRSTSQSRRATGRLSRSDSSNPPPIPQPSSSDAAELLRIKMQKAIRAAQDADEALRQQGVLPPTKPEEPSIKEQISRQKAIEEIESEGFAPKNFTSSVSEVEKKVETVKPSFTIAEATDSICHPNLLADQSGRTQRWIRKLFLLRQKALHGEPLG